MVGAEPGCSVTLKGGSILIHNSLVFCVYGSAETPRPLEIYHSLNSNYAFSQKNLTCIVIYTERSRIGLVRLFVRNGGHSFTIAVSL
jgi:hypothetical protein